MVKEQKVNIMTEYRNRLGKMTESYGGVSRNA